MKISSKIILALLLCLWTIVGYSQQNVKYSIVTDAGLQINVLADGSSDTVSAEYIPPLEYIALLTQSSTGDPTVVQVFKNTLGLDVVWSYTSTGTYTGSIATATVPFPADRTVGEAFLQARGSNPRSYALGRASDTSIILTAMNSSLAASDPATSNTILVQVKVYY